MTRVGIPYEEALATVLAAVAPLGPETTSLAEAAGRVLVSAIVADTHTVPAGHPLRPQELALLAAHGISELRVVRRPRVAIVATGDELVAPGTPLAPGKIYDSDSALLAAMVSRDGGLPLTVGIAHDSVASLRMRLADAIARGAELILTAAGSHNGKHDIVRTLLELEGRLYFWQVAMEPDRPLLFGDLAGVPVIGLPGDPAEALICAELFVRPTLLRLGGHNELSRPKVRATLEIAVARHPNRHYVRGVVRHAGAGYAVRPRSLEHGVEAALAEANALVVIPPGVGMVPAGSPVEALLIDRV
ncbi:MAG: molybdopterin molybdotransferase MoeA [Chloroflexales bacterium]|nr:molybdopterin molybdotransferase MoeA [Chloroflexales bacterium]